MSSLYNITEEQRLLMNEIESLDGEITPEIEELLIINEKQLQSKSIAYLEVISNKQSLNTLIDAEIKRLQSLKKRNNTLVSFLKNNLLNAVKTFGGFNVGFTSFGVRKSTSVEVKDVNSLPDNYKVIKVTEQADKMALKKALKSGELIKGVALKENLNLKIN